jgi:hypothetical protein
MVSIRLPQRAAASLAMSLALVVSACIFKPDDGDPLDPPDPRLQRDTIEHTIEYVETVWHQRLYTEYEDVLHDQFEFFPLERDAGDFPWITGSSWPRTEELNMAAHMFDANFSGQENPIDVIEISLTELSRRDLGNNHTEVTCTQQGRVLTDSNDGWSFDTRVVLEIVPDPDQPGLLQVIKQTEIDAV